MPTKQTKRNRRRPRKSTTKPKPKPPPRNSVRIQLQQSRVARPRRRFRKRNMLNPVAVKAAHTYLDPFVTKGHVVASRAHPPYLLVESTRRWSVTLADNQHLLLYLCWTGTKCRGFATQWTTGGTPSGYPIIATQLGTLTPTDVIQQRLGVQVTNTTAAVNVAGVIYHLSTTDPIGVNFESDNPGDPYIRLSLAEAERIALLVATSSRTRTISASNTRAKPLKAINTIANDEFQWQRYTNVATANDSNVYYETAISTADLTNTVTATVIYIPATGLTQNYFIDVKSQDGCRFEMDHALFSAQKRAPIAPQHHVTNMHQHAHNSAPLGEMVPHHAPPHEHSTMSTISGFIHGAGDVAEQAAYAIPRIANTAWNAVTSGRALRSLWRGAGDVVHAIEGPVMRAAPLIEEVAEDAAGMALVAL